VERGEYAALIVIPADFSARLSPAIDFAGTASSEPVAPTSVEIYANEGAPVSASIVRSVVEGFVDRLVGGNIAISASINALIATNPLAARGPERGQRSHGCLWLRLQRRTGDRHHRPPGPGRRNRRDAGPNFTTTT
jgi:hypothetical protein